MRIGIDGRSLRDGYPGIGRYVHNLIAAMQPLLDDDTLVILHDPAVKTRYDIKPLADKPGIELVPFDVAPRALSQQWKLPKLLRGLSLDVFHAPHYLTAYRSLPCPQVVTLHDLIPIVCPASMPRPLDRTVYRAATRLAAQRAAQVITCSQSTRNDLVRLYGTPAERINVIHEAAAPMFSPVAEAEVRQTREEYSIPARYILHVGVNKPHKNLSVLLEAYHSYYIRTPAEQRAALVLVGEHDSRYASPRRWAAQLGLSRSVLALGNIPDEDLRALYSGAACFAFPSLYEGFGLPVLEAMACGAPVVCSSASSLPEVTGDAAILLPPSNVASWTKTLSRLLEDRTLQASLRSRGLTRAGQFSWAIAARETLVVYRKAAEAV